MTPERHQQIGKIYHAALELDPAQRKAFLDKICAEDMDLRQRVEELLQADERAREFMAQPALDVVAGVLSEQASRLVGHVLGQYQILSLLGTGGMGEVYLARDTRLGRKVALKLLPSSMTQNAERVQRFEQEARTASALNHPNIITIFEIGQFGGTHFIATEYIEGETLRQRMKSRILKLGEVIEIISQAASGLAAAHEAEVVHRDVKPENIMLRPDGYIKLLDFGLAKLSERRAAELPFWEAGTRNEIVTAPGIVLGTVTYMSPEQVRAAEIDARSDVFSLGAVLYELVAGRVPFEGATTSEVIAAILDQEPPPLARYSREVPAELERIVTKALRKNRAQRYQLAQELVIDLRSLKLELEVAARLRSVAPSEDSKRAGPQPTPQLPSTTVASPPTSSLVLEQLLEPVGGAVPLDSRLYIVRSTDEKFGSAIARQDSVVLVKGPRQVGKTSLLARGLQKAREAGARIVLTDFQNLSAGCLESIEKLLLVLAESFADQLELDVPPSDVWKTGRSPTINFEQYLRREVLPKASTPVVWGLDEVDRLFACRFGGEVFGLFRSWHNRRALDPTGPWRQLTLAIAYATEAHLFITDLNQSPFNVGTRLLLEDFTFQQVEELNRRYDSPVKGKADLAAYFRLLGGHPYLVRRGLHEMVANHTDLARLMDQADHDEGPFGDHLRRLLLSLTQDHKLVEVVRGMLQGRACTPPESFYRLRSAGLAIGDSPKEARLRCQLYTSYLEKHLL